MKNSRFVIPVFFIFYASQVYALVSVPDAATMLQNLGNHIPELMKMVTAMAYVMGFFFTYKGLIGLKKFGEQRTMMTGEHHIMGPLVYLFVGAMLIYLPATVHTGVFTLFTEWTPYAYDTGAGDAWSGIKNSVLLLVQLVGVISFIRGLVLLTHIGGGQGGGQPGTFGRALAHIIAGVFCINLTGFVDMISSTLGIQWS